jgi:hypothetical protein
MELVKSFPFKFLFACCIFLAVTLSAFGKDDRFAVSFIADVEPGAELFEEITLTASPTTEPTFVPTVAPTMEPTYSPTVEPTYSPTVEPTFAPTTSMPSSKPTTTMPSSKPTTTMPSSKPTTTMPSFVPSAAPSTVSPSVIPTATPSYVPTDSPTLISQFPTIIAETVSFTAAQGVSGLSLNTYLSSTNYATSFRQTVADSINNQYETSNSASSSVASKASKMMRTEDVPSFSISASDVTISNVASSSATSITITYTVTVVSTYNTITASYLYGLVTASVEDGDFAFYLNSNAITYNAPAFESAIVTATPVLETSSSSDDSNLSRSEVVLTVVLVILGTMAGAYGLYVYLYPNRSSQYSADRVVIDSQPVQQNPVANETDTEANFSTVMVNSDNNQLSI